MTTGDAVAGLGPTVRVGYLMSRFPKLSETFVINEILAVERAGVHCELFPLIHEREPVPVAGTDDLVRRAHYQPAMSPRIIGSLLAWLAERPVRLITTLTAAFAGVLGSRKFTFGLIGLLPKTLHNARVARTLGIDHFHAHFAHHPAMAAWIIHRLTGIPYSFTAHGHDVQVDRRMLCRKLADASFATTISRHNQALVAETCPGGADRIEVLHTGVDTGRLVPGQPSERAEAHWRSGRIRLLSVGRLEEVKGHEHLIRGTALAVDAGHDVEVSIVGEGPRRTALERLIEEHALGDRVRLLGPRSHDDVIDLMRSAHAVVLPSAPTSDGRVEGIPVVLMEAMSVGAAVAASRLPGVVELVGEDHALLFEPAVPAAIADVIARVARDPEVVTDAALAGRDRVRQSFDIGLTAESLAARFRAARPHQTTDAPTA